MKYFSHSQCLRTRHKEGLKKRKLWSVSFASVSERNQEPNCRMRVSEGNAESKQTRRRIRTQTARICVQNKKGKKFVPRISKKLKSSVTRPNHSLPCCQGGDASARLGHNSIGAEVILVHFWRRALRGITGSRQSEMAMLQMHRTANEPPDRWSTWDWNFRCVIWLTNFSGVWRCEWRSSWQCAQETRVGNSVQTHGSSWLSHPTNVREKIRYGFKGIVFIVSETTKQRTPIRTSSGNNLPQTIPFWVTLHCCRRFCGCPSAPIWPPTCQWSPNQSTTHLICPFSCCLWGDRVMQRGLDADQRPCWPKWTSNFCGHHNQLRTTVDSATPQKTMRNNTHWVNIGKSHRNVRQFMAETCKVQILFVAGTWSR